MKHESNEYSDKFWALWEEYFWLIAIMWGHRLIPSSLDIFWPTSPSPSIDYVIYVHWTAPNIKVVADIQITFEVVPNSKLPR